jgi:hypothetical protein
MDHLPSYLAFSIALVTALTVLAFYRASHFSRPVLIILLMLLLLQGGVTASGFYSNATGFAPRFMLLLAPAFAVIALLFLTKRGRRFLGSLDLNILTLLHTVRISVELILFGLYRYRTVPQLMTFENGNLDILSGLTAPIIALMSFRGGMIRNPRLLLGWNMICLSLLGNIVVRAIFSVPSPFQQWGLLQPNIAILYFPFSWLPCCIVPLVLLSHLAAVRRLLLMRSVRPVPAPTVQ